MRRIIKSIGYFLVLAAMGVSAAYLEYANQELRTGSARVIDGDSIVVAGDEVRLQGIDAPELFQQCGEPEKLWPCGRKSKDQLRKLTMNRKVECQGGNRDKFGRLLAVCSVAGQELNRSMVLNGYAVGFGRYQDEEATARDRKAGIWRSRFQKPQDWRRANGQKTESPTGKSIVEKLFGTGEKS